MRGFLIRRFLPLAFCAVPVLGGVLVAAAAPTDARNFYLSRLAPMDGLILGLGFVLFLVQIVLSWQALQWRVRSFDERPDRWLSNLAQAAEWFPMLGLIGTVGGILQTFSQIKGHMPQDEIIRLYSPALTATGSGLFMALLNILPTWVVLIGRGLIVALGGGQPAVAEEGRP